MSGSRPEDAPQGRRSGFGLYRLVNSGELEFERVAFFSDAVFAIAVTLLIINIHVPAADGTGPALARFGRGISQELGRILSWALSFYVVVTRKFDPPMPRRAAPELVVLYATWPVVQVDLPLIVAASELEERHALSFWDALVVKAAHRAKATRLVTEDLQPGRAIAGVAVENPFA